MDAGTRKLPIVDELSAPFWAAAAEGRLVMQRLPDGTLQWPPRSRGVPGWDQPAEWIEVSGRGTVWSFSIVHRSSHAMPPVPYVLVVVALEEGPFMFADLVGADPAEVRIGMPVQVTFEPLGDGALPQFTPRA